MIEHEVFCVFVFQLCLCHFKDPRIVVASSFDREINM